jgi:hypothetical protein
MQALPSQDRKSFCKLLGGYLLELETAEDYSALVYYIWKLITHFGKSNSTSIATGAGTEPLLNNSGHVLLWRESKGLVDYSVQGMIRPAGSVTPTLQSGQTLFLKPFNYASNSTFSPNFTLQGILSNGSSEFICLKPGKYNVMLPPPPPAFNKNASLSYFKTNCKILGITAPLLYVPAGR